MASGIQKKLRETNKATNTMTEQLNNLKGAIDNNTANIQRMAGWIDNKYQSMEEIVDAVINILGTDAVYEQIKKSRIEKAESNAEAQKVALEQQIAEGKVKVAEAVSEVSVIVGSEVDKDGNALPPSRAQILFAQLKPEFATPFLGKKVGDVIETLVGSKFTINEIYDMVLPDPMVKDNEVVQNSNDSVN